MKNEEMIQRQFEPLVLSPRQLELHGALQARESERYPISQ